MRIHISDNLRDLTGSGEEWLVDATGEVIAVLIDGNLRGSNEDETVTIASHNEVTV